MRAYCCIVVLAAQTVLSGGQADTTVPKVVFVKGTEVFSVSAYGTKLMQLTKGGGRKGLPRWSPDGARIAYIGEARAAMGQFTLIASNREHLADFPIRPEEAHEGGMRFIEGLEWLDATRVSFWGSANPRNCSQVTLDTTTGKEVEWHFGTCDTSVRSPDGTRVAYWAAEGMGVADEDRREILEISDARVYPQNPKAKALQFRSKPAWSADSQRVALVDCDMDAGVTYLTVVDGRPARTPRPAEALMHTELTESPDDGLDDLVEVQWVRNSIVVSKDGVALYEADPQTRTIQRATADTLQALAAPRAQAARLKSTIDDLMRKLGGRDPDIWTGVQSTAPSR
jgi:hypothetical protein